jgi:hypothetical protein
MLAHSLAFNYVGYDVSERMLSLADRSEPSWDYTSRRDELQPADYVVASGVFNLRFEVDNTAWREYVVRTIREFASLAQLGFAFNMLTSYSDADKMRADLYYGDPCFFFDHCKREYSRNVALLHDYELYEFTVLVRR